ncbi:MAG: SpoIIE family protein phosphatase [Desulfobacterales bacterium]
MFRLKTLQSQFTLFMILPVGILLIIVGSSAFFYARDLVLSQWRDASILRLQRTAHEVDMRLGRIKDWIMMFQESSGTQYSESFHSWILEHLSKREGVVGINLIWDNPVKSNDGRGAIRDTIPHESRGMHGMGMMQMPMMRRFNSARIREITPPRFDTGGQHGTFSLISDLNDENGQPIGQLDVVVDFTFIFRHVIESGWWQSNKAFLVDDRGQILVCTVPGRHGNLSDTDDPLERETLKAMASAPYGTLLGQGHPPEEVSGYFHLKEAPWSLVMIAPGAEILAPVVQLRLIFFLVGIVTVAVIISLIRIVTLRTTAAIKKVSDAALKLSSGEFIEPLPATSHDEVGDLTRSFNTMSNQLKERMQMKRSLSLAKEVQQNLIPSADPKIDGLDIAGRSEFCDETGGDYYDYIEENDAPGRRIRIVIGDVAGHGVSSALLMSGVRAGFRQRHSMSGSIEEVVADLNRQVALDVGSSGRFMTLFCLEIDVECRCARWARAGHEPGLLYRVRDDRFEPLMGKGIPLGVEKESTYSAQFVDHFENGDMFILGTDGLWETTDPSHEMFGKRRFKEIIRAHRDEGAASLLAVVFDEIHAFARGEVPQDDITLVIAKIA